MNKKIQILKEDIIGKCFNEWTALELFGSDNQGRQLVTLACMCDATIEWPLHRLTKIKRKKIDIVCCNMCLINEFTGSRFGKWVLYQYAYNQHNKSHYLCRCDCGTIEVKQLSSLVSKTSTSCVQCRKHFGHPSHGKTATKEWYAWNKAKKNMIERWQDFSVFFQDTGPCPDPAYFLCRPDINQLFSPGNCVWAPRSEFAKSFQKKMEGTCITCLKEFVRLSHLKKPLLYCSRECERKYNMLKSIERKKMKKNGTKKN